MYTVGKHVIIGTNVKIGEGSIIGHNVVIYDDTIIGKGVNISDNAVIGKLPMKAITSATTSESKLEPTNIGDNVLIGTSAIIYRGVSIANDVFIADLASVRERVSIGEKSIIGRNNTIENNVSIGCFCKIQSNVQIVPYSIIEDWVFIGPGVMTSNDAYAGRTEKRFKEYKGITVKKGARLGVAVVTTPGIIIGEDALIGAGSVVIKNIPAKKIAIGVPAKIIGDVPVEQLLENQTFFKNKNE